MADVARRDWWKMAIVAVVLIELLGGASGWLSNSGYENGWFAALDKPGFMPPGWTFGVVWPILYALLGIALHFAYARYLDWQASVIGANAKRQGLQALPLKVEGGDGPRR